MHEERKCGWIEKKKVQTVVQYNEGFLKAGFLTYLHNNII